MVTVSSRTITPLNYPLNQPPYQQPWFDSIDTKRSRRCLGSQRRHDMLPDTLRHRVDTGPCLLRLCEGPAAQSASDHALSILTILLSPSFAVLTGACMKMAFAEKRKGTRGAWVTVKTKSKSYGKQLLPR